MVTITENAAEKLGGILEQKGMKETHGLRVFVKGGGCGGMQYGMTFDDAARDGDQVYEQNGLRVFVDPTSLFYIEGANIDYVDNLMGGGFHIDNPNAVSSCGCGSSFRTAHSHTGEEMPQSCGH
ncbi:MAG TPA: iron-sulfur cluster insertion protein ErpA [Caldilineaceae bacterium]|nr:iron-sulfur cluster insertion protein ErpA [Caldilineaceae bacterium]